MLGRGDLAEASKRGILHKAVGVETGLGSGRSLKVPPILNYDSMNWDSVRYIEWYF